MDNKSLIDNLPKYQVEDLLSQIEALRIALAQLTSLIGNSCYLPYLAPKEVLIQPGDGESRKVLSPIENNYWDDQVIEYTDLRIAIKDREKDDLPISLVNQSVVISANGINYFLRSYTNWEVDKTVVINPKVEDQLNLILYKALGKDPVNVFAMGMTEKSYLERGEYIEKIEIRLKQMYKKLESFNCINFHTGSYFSGPLIAWVDEKSVLKDALVMRFYYDHWYCFTVTKNIDESLRVSFTKSSGSEKDISLLNESRSKTKDLLEKADKLLSSMNEVDKDDLLSVFDFKAFNSNLKDGELRTVAKECLVNTTYYFKLLIPLVVPGVKLPTDFLLNLPIGLAIDKATPPPLFKSKLERHLNKAARAAHFSGEEFWMKVKEGDGERLTQNIKAIEDELLSLADKFASSLGYEHGFIVPIRKRFFIEKPPFNGYEEFLSFRNKNDLQRFEEELEKSLGLINLVKSEKSDDKNIEFVNKANISKFKPILNTVIFPSLEASHEEVKKLIKGKL